MAREPVVLRGTLLSTSLDCRPPCRSQHGRDRKRGEQSEPRINGDQQCDRHRESQDPAAGGEDRHVQMIEHKHLVTEHGQAIQIVGALVMRDRRDRGLEASHVRFQRDLDLVAKTSLQTDTDGAQEPRCGGGHRQSDGREEDETSACLEHSLAEQHEPQRDERIGERGKLRHEERDDHQSGLVAVAELAQSPHGGERGWQLVRSAARNGFSRGRHRALPPRPPRR